MECPECQASSFLHQDPKKSAAELEQEKAAREQLRSMTPGERKKVAQDWSQENNSAQVQLSQKEKALGPEKLEAFRRRYQKELLELEYIEWRSLQPGWKGPEMQQRLKNISSTAAGVAIGTSFMNGQLRSLRDEISGEGGEGGEDEGGVMDWIGDIFN